MEKNQKSERQSRTSRSSGLETIEPTSHLQTKEQSFTLTLMRTRFHTMFQELGSLAFIFGSICWSLFF